MKKFLTLFLATISLFAGVNYDGTDDYAVVTDATHPTEYTCAAWVLVDTVAYRSIIFRTDGGALPSSSFSHTMRITAGSKFEHYTYDGSLRTVTGSTTVSSATWYHVAITAKNGGNCRLYVNGTEEGTATACTTLWTGGTRYLIAAANAHTTSYFDGKIADLCWWNKELTATEVAALASSRMKYHPTQIQSSSIRFYLPLDDFADGATVTGANSLVDRSGGGRHGTPNNSPTGYAENALSYP